MIDCAHRLGLNKLFCGDQGMARRNYSKNYYFSEDPSVDEKSSLAAAMRDSSAHRDSSLSSVYRESALASAHRESSRQTHSSNLASLRFSQQKPHMVNGSSSVKSPTEPKQGFWSALAKKAKSALLEEGSPVQGSESQMRNGSDVQEGPANIQSNGPDGRQRQIDTPVLLKGIDAIANSLTFIGGSIGNALEIRLQLETLLAEKSRLAQENANYARENRFLREIVEYHQLTMQDVVLLDESIQDVTDISLDPAAETQMEMLTIEKSISTVSH